jgi:hypothetical protein
LPEEDILMRSTQAKTIAAAPGPSGKRGNDEVIQLIGGNHPLKKGMFPLKHIQTAISR